MDSKKINTILGILNTLIQAGIFIVAFLGIRYVVEELSLLRHQSVIAEDNISLLKKEMKLAQRPMGLVISSYYENSFDLYPKTKMFFNYAGQENEPDQFIIYTTPRFINYGKDALVYIGSIGYRSPDTINFRLRLFNNRIVKGDLKYGFIKNFLSRTTILPQRMIVENFKFYQMNYEKTYYFYYIYFYEDINGNLYDTEHVDIVSFTEKRFVNNKLDIKPEYYQEKNTYHSYSKEERRKLTLFFKEHPKDDHNAETIYLSLKKDLSEKNED